MDGIGTRPIRVAGVVLGQCVAIDVQNLFPHRECVTRHTNHSLHIVLERVMRRIEDDDVIADRLLPARNPHSEKGNLRPVDGLVDEEKISN